MAFKKILIANRGEIALRILQTCQRLGVETVAVYSDADRHSSVVASATQAVHLGAAVSAESYLNQDKIIKAALDTGAEAIHPGYGFLSENADFARACEQAGLVFIGPKADTIALMGSKIESKKRMHKAGVPVVPGYYGDQQDPAHLQKEATQIGYPLLIKASAGGGGKGMRVVRQAAQFDDALGAAKREAMRSFGDDKVLLEKLIQQPRHIEVQVFGDAQGQVVHLFERECSIQRRYQKIIEEAPSPFVTQALREALTSAAIQAAAAVGYQNAGTVEFIVDSDHQFYFMEMNTRLQVEHAVTEMVTGIDLVAWQLQVAAGEPLPLDQSAIRCEGHAIEARIYSEDPYHDFLPATGKVHQFVYPQTDDQLRMDTAIENGSSVTVYYDPMIAKIISHGPNRDIARERLATALARTALLEPCNNLVLLRRIVQHSAFVHAHMDTSYLDQHLAELLRQDSIPAIHLCAAALVAMRQRDRGDSPWDRADGWQANGASQNRMAMMFRDGSRHIIHLRGWMPHIEAQIGDTLHRIDNVRWQSGTVSFVFDRQQAHVWYCHDRRFVQVSHAGRTSEIRFVDLYPVERDLEDALSHPGSPMPGRVVSVLVQVGDVVEVGQKLLSLEGMKMEFTLTAGVAGKIESIHCQAGDLVDAEVSLVDITSA